MSPTDTDDVVRRYLILGLRLGRHVDGLVDAYYGPEELEVAVSAEPVAEPSALAHDARRLLADLESAAELHPGRRRWIAAQTTGLLTTARKLGGEPIGYVEEVETSYDVTPTAIDEDDIVAAHRRLDEALVGSGDLRDRLQRFRDAHAIPTDALRGVIDSLAAEFRRRTAETFGLPEGESIDFELVSNQPWSGFNYYLGDLRSRVAINTDLPVLSTSIGHLVAHEAYPGHHTEHCRKEIGLVRQRGYLEETIFVVGTPQCVIAEGLADLAIEVLLGADHRQVMAELLAEHPVTYDVDAIDAVAEFGEMSHAVRGNVGLLLHAEGAEPADAVAYAQRWLILDTARAEKVVEFQSDPTWRAYISCYIEGLPLCRNWVGGDSTRFERLITDPFLPSDLRAA